MLHATVFAQGSRLQGTVHDFSELKGLDGGMRETDRCLVCHAVLQAMAVPVGAGMLWDRGQAQTTFTTYTFTDGSSAGQPTGPRNSVWAATTGPWVSMNGTAAKGNTDRASI